MPSDPPKPRGMQIDSSKWTGLSPKVEKDVQAKEKKADRDHAKAPTSDIPTEPDLLPLDQDHLMELHADLVENEGKYTMINDVNRVLKALLVHLSEHSEGDAG